jgi:phosphoribosylformylglycinamidine (FGAM) synthase-like enzyme
MREKRHGDFVREGIRAGSFTAVHDLSDGGLALAVAEMALASGLGARLGVPPGLAHAAWFGEDQARYVATVPAETAGAALAAATAAGVPACVIGAVSGDAVDLAGSAMPLTRLREAHEGWFPRFMG